ncbi:MAG TPA: GntR family transcriptional regulator [Dehalococcoidia bacterium]|jgi:GntR family transcriptional regulator
MNPKEVIADIASSLDPLSRQPLYEQLTAALREAVETGGLPPGTALPPEKELAALLSVSRQTVSVALTKLSKRGLIYRRRGTGTFVAEPFVEQPLGGLYSFMHSLESQGRSPGSRLLGFQVVVDDRASPLLEGSPDSLVYEIKRLRLVDDEPFAVETTYLGRECGAKIPLDRLEHDALYDLIEQFCGITVSSARETLRPVTLDKTDSHLLNVHPGEPAFLVERVGYSGEQAVELRVSLIRGDRYRFRVELSGNPSVLH